MSVATDWRVELEFREDGVESCPLCNAEGWWIERHDIIVTMYLGTGV